MERIFRQPPFSARIGAFQLTFLPAADTNLFKRLNANRPLRANADKRDVPALYKLGLASNIAGGNVASKLRTTTSCFAVLAEYLLLLLRLRVQN